jgi:hypothetical protein
MARAISDIEAEVRGLWLAEVQQRSAEFDASLVKLIPAEEVFERLRAQFKR